jgi:hypothetical protein
LGCGPSHYSANIIGPESLGDSKVLAPGQLIGPEDPGLSQEFSPGSEALEEGIIGPE